jgi:hypothetical protein
LHLAVFDRLADDARETEYRTLQELYEQLTNDVRRRATERAGGNLDWQGITSRLVAYMSDHESLAAPRALLDDFNVAEDRCPHVGGGAVRRRRNCHVLPRDLLRLPVRSGVHRRWP